VLTTSEVQQIYFTSLSKYDTDKWVLYVNQSKNSTVEGLDDGLYNYTAYANDTAGNLNSTETREITIDGTTPTITLPVYTNGTLKLNTDTLTLNISVSDTDLTGAACFLNINGTNQTIFVESGWCNTTEGNLTGLVDGNQTITVYANDTAGNLGVNDSFVVQIDGTAPTITLPVYTNGTQKDNTETLTFNISVIDSGVLGDNCFVNINGTNQTIGIESGWCNTTEGNLTNLATGNRTITVYSNDSLGNAAINNSFVVDITTPDTTAPTISLPEYTNGTLKLNTDTLTLNISVTDDVDLTGAACFLQINGTNQTIFVESGWCNTTEGNLTALSDGNQTITVYVNDTAGNLGVNDSFVVDIDGTAPTISLPVYTNGTLKLNTETLTLNISIIDSGVLGDNCFLNINGTNQTIGIESGWCNTTEGNLTALADGNQTITVYVNDSLGNAAINNSFVVQIDGTAPVIELPVYTNGTLKVNTDTLTLNISVSDSALGGAACFLNINGTNQTIFIESGWCNTTEGNLTSLSDGNQTITVYVNDSIGNLGLNDSFVVQI